MLKHLNEKPLLPSRVVVLGARGFVGSHIMQELTETDINVLGFSRDKLNLLDSEAPKILLEHLGSTDALVVVSALAPCKNNNMLIDNLKMMQAICTVLEKITVSQLIYISSDAVYADEVVLATESSIADPSTLHGMMHSTRELMLKTTAANRIPLAILRPSLLYGLGDPHNGYGPNRFRRLVEEKKTISLFGEGEEKRDHIFIKDVAKVVSLTLQHRSQGILNIATGESHSFRAVAEMVVSQFGSSVEIQGTLRQNPITHRHFDITNCYKAFPHFHYTSLQEGISQMVHKVMEPA